MPCCRGLAGQGPEPPEPPVPTVAFVVVVLVLVLVAPPTLDVLLVVVCDAVELEEVAPPAELDVADEVEVVVVSTPEPPTSSTGFWRRVGDTVEVSISTVIANCSSATGQIHWSYSPGITPDTTMTADLVGHGIGVANNATYDVDLEDSSTFLSLDKAPAIGGLNCSQVPDNTIFRLRFAIPVQGWTVSN